jgi:hypothetical protein
MNMSLTHGQGEREHRERLGIPAGLPASFYFRKAS